MENSNIYSNDSNQMESKIERFSFTGKGGEYFGIWIVNILLTIVTLGIYSAWAKVRNKQYFYGNTFLDNSSFEYTAQPLQILKGRVIAVVVFILYNILATYMPTVGLILALALFALAPWIIMKSLAFNARYSQYRNIRFGFHQHLPEAIKVFVLIPLLIIVPFFLIGAYAGATGLFEPSTDGETAAMSTGFVIAVGVAFLLALLAYPYVAYRSSRYIADNHQFGTADFNLRLENSKPVYSIYFKAFAILIGLVIVLMLLAALFGFLGLAGAPANTEQGPVAGFLFIVIQIAIMCVYLFMFAYIKAKSYNLYYQNTLVGRHKLRANMAPTGLAWIYFTNTLGIIVTLGIFIPWAMVRAARYRADHTALQVQGDMNDFVGKQEEEQNAFGEELGEVFDLDIAI